MHHGTSHRVLTGPKKYIYYFFWGGGGGVGDITSWGETHPAGLYAYKYLKSVISFSVYDVLSLDQSLPPLMMYEYRRDLHLMILILNNKIVLHK